MNLFTTKPTLALPQPTLTRVDFYVSSKGVWPSGIREVHSSSQVTKEPKPGLSAENSALKEDITALSVQEFTALHLTENFANAVKDLKGLSGVYCIKHQDSGCMYIGSSGDLSVRLYAHIVTGNTNVHLQSAIIKYGLASFTFRVIELCSKEELLEREQF